VTVAYLTDVEGRWDKLASFATSNPLVALVGDRLELAPGATFVFGGDAIDRGPHGRKIVRTLLAAKRAYRERVVLLAGNRDLNKLRLLRELDAPPAFVPATLATRGQRLRWLLAHTMGAPEAFEYRAAELAAEGTAQNDEAVASSFLDELAPGGELRAYLGVAQLAHRSGTTLFVHGGVTPENLFCTPGRGRARDVDSWLANLDEFHAAERAVLDAGGEPRGLLAYQGPLPGTTAQQASVIYARPTDELGNPCVPPASVIARLRESGVERVVVGHTPSGDCPAIVRAGGFELVLADNSYGRIERGSQLAFTDDTTFVRGATELDDGSLAEIDFALARGESSPLGARDATGALIKARLADGRYLLFRGLTSRRVSQVAVVAAELRPRRARTMEVHRDL
jgi:hypothetical protein